ncbi:MAG: hypothetical protein IJQ21_11705 [Lachnospiraceae bacterium]|nr:hypothetical protein [Lachnospiraceae bacterium]
MKKGMVTRWKRPLAAALGALFVLGAVCGMGGGVLPDGVRDALPDSVREALAPITAQAADGDPAITQGAEVLRQNANAASGMQKVWYAGRDWYVIGFDGTGNSVAAKGGAITLLHQGVGVHMKYKSDGSSNEYGTSDLKTYIESWLSTGFSAGEEAAILPRNLEGGSANQDVTGYDSNKISGSAVWNAKLWPLSVAEANEVPIGIRAVGTGISWWLRSPGHL